MTVKSPRILVTGGAGYIGLHVCDALLRRGCRVHVIDSFMNSWPELLERLVSLHPEALTFNQADILTEGLLPAVLCRFKPSAVIHLAGLKSAPESIEFPLLYWNANVLGTVRLLEAMEASGCKRIVFSSTAAIYGDEPERPKIESDLASPKTPYARSKHAVETLLADWCAAAPDRGAISLRYFNPVGADEQLRFGELPRQQQLNLMPAIIDSVRGRRGSLDIFGDDYPTPDGTGMRDFIHVVDLAEAHFAAALSSGAGHRVYNVGTGTGLTVLSLIRIFEQTVGLHVPHRIVDRRHGDIAVSVADPTRIKAELGWQARLALQDMCRSAWDWAMKDHFLHVRG